MKDQEIQIIRNRNEIDGIIWMQDMGFEPYDEKNIKTMGKEATSKDIRREKD